MASKDQNISISIIVRIRSAGNGIPKAMQPRLGFIFLYYKQQN